MYRYRKQVVFIFLALFFNFASLAIARMGQEYHCSIGFSGVASNRDERGIPLTYVRRSIQDTACAPIDTYSGERIDEAGSQIYFARLILDLAFWYVALVFLSI